LQVQRTYGVPFSLTKPNVHTPVFGNPSERIYPVVVTENARFHGLDALRAAMMLLGLVLHVATSFVASPADGVWPLRDPHPTGLAGLVVLAIHAFRMPAFFMLSGFFGALVVSRKGMGAWVGDRARRILFPMVVAWIALFPLIKLAFTYAIGRAAEASGGGDVAVPLIGSAMQHPWRDPSPAHLWFLLYLLWFCAAAACAWVALRVVPRTTREAMRGACANAVARWCSGWRSVLAVLALALVAALPMLAMPSPGIATPRSFAPEPAILLCYGVFFFGGWILALDPRAIHALKRGAWWRVAAGCVALAVAVVLSIAWYVAVGQGRSPTAGGMRVLFVLTQGATALAAWLLALGCAGAVERIFRAPSRGIRFVVDSSYWVYLVHLPVAIFVVGVFAPWNAAGIVKMCVAIAVTAALSFASYAAARAVLPRRA
jgi:peptidoglycan/LPS O-acetylase OafA/YrhL